MQETVILPGAAFVEFALRAGEQVDCGRVEELTLEAPLVLPEEGTRSLDVQITARADDEGGRHSVQIYSRPAGADDHAWTRHAAGTLTPAPPTTKSDQEAAWPPPGAEPVDLADFYLRLHASGFGYGPVFQGLRAAWRRGDEVYAEIALPEDAPDATAFGLHPALLDTALHGIGLGDYVTDSERGSMPFSFSGVSLTAAGAQAGRVRLAPAAGEGVSVQISDHDGAPIASVDALVLRPVAEAALAGQNGPAADSLFRLNWAEIPVQDAGAPAPAELTAAADLRTVAPAEALLWRSRPTFTTTARTACAEALGVLQNFLTDERFADTVLVVLTRGAVATTVAEDIADQAGAAVVGLVRSAQAEHPGRIVLVDTDDDERLLAAALQAGEPQLALRDGTVRVPRLTRVPAADAATDEQQTAAFGDCVLVTGGTGGLGRLVARHLVERHGASHVVLTSRRGMDAPGADSLRTELEGLGARATVVACDVTDGPAVEGLFAAYPVDSVVHAAGVLDDGVLTSLDEERLGRVLSPKVEAAWNLHEATRHRALRAFVLFSSVAGVLGSPGQGAYAAANAGLDALAAHRLARGLPAVSLAWGLWSQSSDMTDGLGEADRARMTRGGVMGLSDEEGLALLDASLATTEPVLVPMRLDLAALRRQAAENALAPVYSSLVRVPVRRTSADNSTGRRAAELRDTVRALAGEEERVALLLDVVRKQVADVLGHARPEAIGPKQQFSDIGFDSLTAVELRNRLGTGTGLRLPATLIFDYPTPDALARFLLEGLAVEAVEGLTVTAELDRLERVLTRTTFDADSRMEFATRLYLLLSEYGDDSTTGPDDGSDVVGAIHSASDDELFDFIDKELG